VRLFIQMHGTVVIEVKTVNGTVAIHDTVAPSDLRHQISIERLRGDQIHDTIPTIVNLEDLIPPLKGEGRGKQ
jgi:hypothetical protein